MLGQPIHDVAITLSYHRAHEDYPSWIAAYEEGYRTVARWPVTNPRIIEALMVARQLLFTNWGEPAPILAAAPGVQRHQSVPLRSRM